MAQTLPVRPPNRDDVFKGFNVDIEKYKEEAEKLSSQETEESKALKKLRETIIPLGQSIRDAEQDLLNITRSIKDKETEQAALQKLLKDSQKILSEGLLAAIRMRRTPTESLFIQTGSAYKTAQTALLLERTVPEIKGRVVALSNTVQRLSELKQELEADQKRQEHKLVQLEEELKEIETLITRRQETIKTIRKDHKAVAQRTETLKKEAKNLQDLIKKVRTQNKMAAMAIEPVIKPSPKTAAKLPPANITASALPVIGTIEKAYGTPDKLGARTQGIKIKTRTKALVTTPLDGTVRFAGDFKNYGQIVIIEHDGDLHSMISGLGKIDIVVGQSLKKGESIGTMPSQNTSDALVLYYELRYRGTPIDPTKKI